MEQMKQVQSGEKKQCGLSSVKNKKEILNYRLKDENVEDIDYEKEIYVYHLKAKKTDIGDDTEIDNIYLKGELTEDIDDEKDTVICHLKVEITPDIGDQKEIVNSYLKEEKITDTVYEKESYNCHLEEEKAENTGNCQIAEENVDSPVTAYLKENDQETYEVMVIIEDEELNCESKDKQSDVETSAEAEKQILNKLDTKTPRFLCNYCNYGSELRSNIINHLNIHETSNIMCRFCKKRFGTYYHLTRHMRSHDKNLPYTCSRCNYDLENYQSLIAHNKMFHAQVKRYSCHYENCSYKVDCKKVLSNHYRKHTGEKPYFCETCDFRTAHKSCIVRHIKGHANGRRAFNCYQCNYKTYNVCRLIIHKQKMNHYP